MQYTRKNLQFIILPFSVQAVWDIHYKYSGKNVR
jgi:hypothetical protein